MFKQKSSMMKTMIATAAVAAFSTGLATRADACQFSTRPVLSEATMAAMAMRMPARIPTLRSEEAKEKAAAAGNSIVGLWKVTLLVNRQPVDQAFEVFHSDGTEELIDQTPPAMGNVCLGVWEESSLRVFVLTHPAWLFDSTGALTGTAMITATVVLSKDGETFSGASTEDTFDLKGKQTSHNTANLEGVRIHP
jgi:hypothetical protein